MSKERELSGRVRSWLREDGHEDADRVLNLVLDQLDTTPQRHAGWLARRFPAMNRRNVTYGLGAAVAVIVLAIAGWQFLPRSNSGNVVPTEEPTPSPTPIALALNDTGSSLDGGRYAVDVGEGDWRFSVELSVPPGWVANVGSNLVGFNGPKANLFPQVNFISVQRVYADPCHPENGVAGTHTGPSNADELVEELSSLPGFDVTEVSTATVGGLTARHFTITQAIDTAAEDCTEDPWLPMVITWDGSVSGELARRNLAVSLSTAGSVPEHFWVISRGQGANPLIMLTETGSPDNPPAPSDQDAIDQIVASITFH